MPAHYNENIVDQVCVDLFSGWEASGVLDLVPYAVLIRDVSDTILYWNDAAEKMYGWSSSQALGRSARQLLQEDIHSAITPFNGNGSGDDSWGGAYRHVTSSGKLIAVHSRRVPSFTKAGSQIVVEINRNLSHRERDEDLPSDSSRMLQSVMDCTTSYIHVRGRKGEFLYVNKEYEKVFSVTRTHVIGKTIEEVFEPIIAASRRAMHEAVLNSAIDLHDEIVVVQLDGPHTYLDVKSPLFDDKGAIYAVYCLGTDITERKRLEAKMRRLAHYDVTTALPNRAFFLEYLSAVIGQVKNTSRIATLLYLDLDRFKDVNDKLGHSSGDQLLIEVGVRIRGCLRSSDTAARMGGDEFTVLIENLESSNDVIRLAKNILAALSKPYQINNEEIHISCSIGIASFPEDAADSAVLLKNADQAMYLSKHLGGNCFSFFSLAIQEAVSERLAMISALRTAVSAKQFELFYQPIVELSTGYIKKAEALIRWNHPIRGVVAPNDFIPLCEDTGLISPIGEWVFRDAARQCALWRAEFDEKFEISINTSPAQYQHRGINTQAWAEILVSFGLARNAIAIEITEGLLMSAGELVADQLRLLRQDGMAISLDDFGTGYSSLSYLRKFHVDFLKIDRSFVSNLAPGSNEATLCEAIIVMAHKLGIRVVAEGVETVLQRDLLVAAGCDFGQGYLFSKPQTAGEFAQLLRNRS